MVLVDTSVWIRALAKQAPYVHELGRLLIADEVAAHELVFGELLIGDKGARATLLTSYARIHYATRVPHAEAVEFVRSRTLYGRGIGWIDAHLLASSVVDGLKLWTADGDLAAIADELGIAYPMTGR